MNLLTKFVRDLTEDDIAFLTKPLGVPGLAYPTLEYGVDENGHIAERLDIIESADNPLRLLSLLPQERVMGALIRDMPVPSMLPILEESLVRRLPNAKNKTLFMIGDAGFGKSYLAKLIARLRDDRGAIVIDCGNRNLDDLLFETTLDMGEDLRHAVQAHLTRNHLSEARLALLREGLGDAFRAEGNGWVIDWDEIGRPDLTREERVDSQTTAQRALKTLETFCRLEGIPLDQSNALGLRMREGELIRAFREGREVIFDEYSKSKEGTDGGLQTVLQFLNGEIDEAVVENKLKIHGREETFRFTFRREAMAAGFFVTLTGNDRKDGKTTRLLSRSVYSRLHPLRTGAPTATDWQHRIAQLLTGLPLTTLYGLYKNRADADPAAFAHELAAIRTLGLSDAEKEDVPTLHFSLLANWPKSVKAIEILADYFMQEALVSDPTSSVFDQPAMAAIADEIDEESRDEASIDFRRAIKVIESALIKRPTITSAAEIGSLCVERAAAAKIERSHDDLPQTATFGTDLVRALLRDTGHLTVGRPNLRRYLFDYAEQKGVVDPRFKEAQRSRKALLSDLLNVDPYAHLGGEKALEKLRDTLFTFLRAAHPEAALDKAANLPIKTVATALETMFGDARKKVAGEHASFPVMGVDPLTTSRVVDLASLIDTAALGDSAVPPDGRTLVAVDAFATGLAFDAPMIPGAQTLWSIADWPVIIGDVTDDSALLACEAVELANGDDVNKPRTTTLLLRDPQTNKATSAHLFQAPQQNGKRPMLLVAQGLSDGMQRVLAAHEITAINRHDAEDQVRLGAWIDNVVNEGKPLTLPQEESLKTAFALRNDLSPEDETRPFVDLLCDATLRPTAPLILRARVTGLIA
jgi:ABC-type oligopeptide transport system ATPase subunit